MSTQKSERRKNHKKQGKRNRQRGAELQRQAVSLAKEFGLEAHNRDRGGAQHEKGDVEIEDKFYGCKRRKVAPKWIFPEKEEVGVIFRAEYKPPFIAVPLEHYMLLLSLVKKEFFNEK
tara:strand:+ start:220 stop:573 length:354 start_codon:yes stop_codon:yes gene_type:complete